MLILTRGIPASGKTTWAREWVAEDETGRARVNRDDLRMNLYGRLAPLPYELEQVITCAQHAAVRGLLNGHIDVVVDDTNIPLKRLREYAKIAKDAGAELDFMQFDTPLEECIERDLHRPVGAGHVGREVITQMHERWVQAKNHWALLDDEPDDEYRYEPDPSLPPAWIFDIDGTLALKSARSPFDWTRVLEDTLNEPVRWLLNGVRDYPSHVIVLSGRDSVCRMETELWLARNEIWPTGLFMRPAGDNRKDSLVKLELFREHVAPHYNVLGVVDDRQQVVDMWRRIGLFCAQVAPGDF